MKCAVRDYLMWCACFIMLLLASFANKSLKHIKSFIKIITKNNGKWIEMANGGWWFTRATHIKCITGLEFVFAFWSILKALKIYFYVIFSWKIKWVLFIEIIKTLYCKQLSCQLKLNLVKHSHEIYWVFNKFRVFKS